MGRLDKEAHEVEVFVGEGFFQPGEVHVVAVVGLFCLLTILCGINWTVCISLMLCTVHGCYNLSKTNGVEYVIVDAKVKCRSGFKLDELRIYGNREYWNDGWILTMGRIY